MTRYAECRVEKLGKQSVGGKGKHAGEGSKKRPRQRGAERVPEVEGPMMSAFWVLLGRAPCGASHPLVFPPFFQRQNPPEPISIHL